MKRVLLSAVPLCLAMGSLNCASDHSGSSSGKTTTMTARHSVTRPDGIEWGPGPAGLPAGAQAAVLAGDPGKPGPFVMRAKMRDGYTVPPHWHSNDENITVIKGTLRVGMGDTLEEQSMTDVPAGGFANMPKKMHHYAMARGETIIQVHGIGPFDIHYINPANDPRKH